MKVKKNTGKSKQVSPN